MTFGESQAERRIGPPIKIVDRHSYVNLKLGSIKLEGSYRFYAGSREFLEKLEDDRANDDRNAPIVSVGDPLLADALRPSMVLSDLPIESVVSQLLGRARFFFFLLRAERPWGDAIGRSSPFWAAFS